VGGVGLEFRMTQLERIADTHRVAIKRDTCNDPIIPGKNGHLYTDDGAVMVCFTDDGGRARREFTARYKNARLQILKPHTVRLKQEGDVEFIAEVTDSKEVIAIALFQVLGVRRFKTTKGVPRPLPPALIAAQSRIRKAP
jgi:hypothetical protein